MSPRVHLPLAALALLLGGAAAQAQTVQPSVRPASPGHEGHDHAAKRGVPNLPAPAGGVLVVESPTFDAGKVERGGKVKHSFTIKNTGTGPLHVDAKPG